MKVITPTGNLSGAIVIGKPPAGRCQECATVHTPDQPHNKQSLAYQYNFRERMGSWPTWADAMAHCSPQVRERWTSELIRLGQTIGELTPDQTKALAVRQPWAWLIVNGFKDIENRTRRCHYRGRVRIHASKEMTRSDYEAAEIFAASCDIVDLPPFDSAELKRGGIVGEVEIVNCHDSSDSPWFFGPFGWQLANAKPLPFQPCKGKLGFFTPDLTPA